MKIHQVACLSIFILVLGGEGALANPVTYDYADWSARTLSTAVAGSVTGTITIGLNTIIVTYTGDVVPATQVGAGGTDYYVPTSVYTNAQVANAPTNNTIVALDENPAFTDTLTFSSPIRNPILDIVSLGAGGSGTSVKYNFNATPVILSQGPGYWAGGCNTCLSVSGNSLIGTEGDGVVEFIGTYSSISWTTTGSEYWNGFTVGVEGVASPVPEPCSFMLLGSGVLGLLTVCKKFRG